MFTGAPLGFHILRSFQSAVKLSGDGDISLDVTKFARIGIGEPL